MIEGAVDDRVGLLRPAAEGRRVLEGAAVDLGADRDELLRSVIGAGEPENLVAALEQVRNDLRADEASSAGEKDSHGVSLMTFVWP